MKKSHASERPQKRASRAEVALEKNAGALRNSDELKEKISDGELTSSYLVPGLERGLRMLSEFSAREPELGAPELSKRIGIPRSTTFRLLQTLEALGFLERAGGDRRFTLGPAVLRLGFEYLNSLEVTEVSTPVLERLRDMTGLSTHLLVRDQRDVIFVAKAQAHEPMFSSVKVHVGTRLPAHATVHGQILMADLTLDQLKQLYPEGKLERFTDQTPTSVGELHKRIRTTAVLGYATSEASFERGISVVTAPVRNLSGHVVAALTATMPRSDLGETAKQEPLVTAVCGAALDVSQRLGYRPNDGDPTVLLAQRCAVASQ
ncbi:IclR family transcriptional regulator [Paraburkholderia sp. ZP32-5]|uniref:IclR family transcriptional regulator n=1 Tax=Paraburkholderia sp. ZP32-5 TaxID=2883245 RepID=UPI001F20464F|nr:IclR family transcriptional regulator [Paraburkholderia sp. ZP32-5]